MAKLKRKNIKDQDQYSGKDVNDLLKDVDADYKQQLQEAQTKATNQISSNLEGSVFNVKSTIEDYSNSISSAIGNIAKTLEDLDAASVEIMNNVGTARNRLGEFRALYSEALPTLTAMGYSDAAGAIKDIGTALGGAASIGVEAVTELAATNKVTGQGIQTLAQNFRDVGVSVYDVADSMKEVVDYTKSVGGNVQDVSSKVVGNLEKLNVYNFSNGVMGLTKMAAQASRLGVDMNTVFTTSEKLLDPDKAIDMAAGLQRLGVANSEMLDPLRLMDMGLNGPDELMKSMADMSKEFVQLNEKGQFEIMPGAKRRMREVASELGMTGEEFSKMALKSADFDRKMKEITMPSFVGSEEDKEMLATMAQMKDGRAVVQVKDETGRIKEKEVKNLTPEDIDNLRLSEEERGKTMEEIALDQLNNLQIIANAQTAVGQRISYAGAASAPVQRAYDYTAGVQRSVAKGIGSPKPDTGFDYGNLITSFNDLTGPLEKMALAAAQGNFGESAKQMNLFITNLGSVETTFRDSLQRTVDDIVTQEKKLRQIYTNNKGTPKISNTSTTGGTIQTPIINATPTQQNLSVQTITATEINQATLSTKSDINVNLKLTAENLPPSLDQTMIKSKIEEYFADYSNVQKLFDTDTNGGLKFKKK